MRRRPRSVAPAIAAALLVCSFVFGLSTARATGTPGVDPSAVTLTLNPGESSVIPKVVHTPTIPPKPDLVFLSDTTGSMGGTITNVRTNAISVMNTVLAAQPQAEFAAAQYKDHFQCSSDPFAFNLDQPITANTTDVQNGINTWTASGGCDTPEQAVYALDQLATGPTGFRTGSSRVIAWFGDAPSHSADGDGLGPTALTTAISDLQAAGIRVIAINVGALDAFGQATQIVNATGGVLLNGVSSSDVSNAILAGLSDLPATVAPAYTCSSPDVTLSYDAPSKTVTSGDDVPFTETVNVSPTAATNQNVHCDVFFTINGVKDDTLVETVDVFIPGADVSMLKTGPSSVTEGQTYAYQLTVANAGPAVAHNATATDSLPANVSFVSASAGCSFASPVVTCNAGNLPAGGSATFTVNVTALSAGSGITNTAVASSSDGDPNTGNNSSTVTTSLNHNPVCSALALSGPDMWPPNHRMVRFTASGATDPDGNTLTTTITHVTQDEPLNGLGDGDTGPTDAAPVAGHSDQVDLRAERSGLGDGRVYAVTVSVTDGHGGSCTATLTSVNVPHDQAHAAVDSGQSFSDF
jgi:uncharacterized repeat protein (TIGR01451 family)